MRLVTVPVWSFVVLLAVAIVCVVGITRVHTENTRIRIELEQRRNQKFDQDFGAVVVELRILYFHAGKDLITLAEGTLKPITV